MMDLSNLEAAHAFFEFMGGQGVNWFFVEAQPRLKTGPKAGKRGAPIGAKFGFQFACRHQDMVAGFKELSKRLAAGGKYRVDLQTRESPGREGARVILVDDLGQDELGRLKGWWSGPIAALETSEDNHQALLISPVGLNDGELSTCQKGLVQMFSADAGAAGVRQLHRFPGSPNFKSAAVVNGQPFFCKLVYTLVGETGGRKQIQELLSNPPSAAPARTRTRRAAADRRSIDIGSDNSRKAWAWTLDQIRKGVGHQQILEGLKTKYLAHHSDSDWPKRTLHNALHFLGLVPTRYKA
jgi:RepB DNA-primase from phage plasmid